MKVFEAKKLYYTIGEVSKITSLPAYLLRQWENIFPNLSPSRNPKGNRIYTNKEIALILNIKNLVYEQGYTIDRAKYLLQEQNGTQDHQEKTKALLKKHQVKVKDQIHQQANHDKHVATLKEMKGFLEDLLAKFS